MARRMLIDATYPEETRVVVLNGNRLEEFDFETSTKKQIKGNIYLAKITRVEPSLQAAFVEYGGNRHGFLAFSEIHPDYYRIPVSDREAILAAEQAEPHGYDDEPETSGHFQPSSEVPDEPTGEHDANDDGGAAHYHEAAFDAPAVSATEESLEAAQAAADGAAVAAIYAEPEHETVAEAPAAEPEAAPYNDAETAAESEGVEAGETEASHDEGEDGPGFHDAPPTPVETVGGDELEEVQARPRVRHYRNYKIQEVIKRRQILLVQVTKEERGTKGAALTTYLSLAGRYCVLMPNAGRGGGVSRKITSLADRRRLKELMDDLDVPEGMGVIVRTAGSERSKAEIKRDYEYLLRLWDDIRELTLRSSAPALIYEEGSLIKRAIRDLYSRDIEEILVEGVDGYRTAKEFMRMLMPSHSARVKPYRDPSIPLFHRFQVDSQIDQIHNPVVQLRSGGYIVINPTEALVSIDVNSGRATKERNIEETATKTNLEAAEEIARQLRLRDLAGLVVIDFIDMEEGRNQKAVEARLKDAMKFDRARIQLGRISPFGLLELSRQRLRSSLIEASTQTCPHCNGTGTIRSTESTSLVVLRQIEEEGIRRRTAELTVFVPTHVALYLLNQKREALISTEQRYGFTVTVAQDDTLIPPACRVERMRAFTQAEIDALPAPVLPPLDEPEEVEEEFIESNESEVAVVAEAASEAPAHGSEEDRGRRRRRRRRRRHGGGDYAEHEASSDSEQGAAEDGNDFEAGDSEAGESGAAAEEQDAEGDEAEGTPETVAAEAAPTADGEPRRRRRGRRGGKRRHHEGEQQPADVPAAAADAEDFESYPSPFDFARDGRVEYFAEQVELTEPEPPEAVEAEVQSIEAALTATPADVSETGEGTASVPEEPVAPETPAAEATAGEGDAPAEKPKRRRAPRRKAAEAEAAAPVAAETPELIEPAPEKPKRTRTRKPKAAAEATPAEAAPVEAPAALPPVAEPAAMEAAVIEAPLIEVPAEAETAPEPVIGESVVDPMLETVAEAATEELQDDRPRRSGWWRRITRS